MEWRSAMIHSADFTPSVPANCERFALHAFLFMEGQLQDAECDCLFDHLAECRGCQDLFVALDQLDARTAAELEQLELFANRGVLNSIGGIDLDGFIADVDPTASRTLGKGKLSAIDDLPLNGSPSSATLLSAKETNRVLSLLTEDSIRQVGHVNFSGRCRTGAYFQFAKLTESGNWNELKSIFLDSLESQVSRIKPDIIVGHTPTMYEVGVGLAERLHMSRRQVAAAYGDRPVVIPTVQGEFRDKTVALLLDVVLSGRTYQALVSLIEETLQARVVYSACLINQGNRHLPLLQSLCQDSAEPYLDDCAECRSGKRPLVFDSNLGLALPERSVADLDESWARHTEEYQTWWTRIAQAAALKRHYQFRGVHYEMFIETTALFESPEVVNDVFDDIRRVLTPVCRGRSGVVLYDASTSRRPAQVASAIGSLFDWECIPVGSRNKPMTLKPSDARRLEGRYVLIADAAINSGTLLRALHQLAVQAGASEVHAFALIDRLASQPAGRDLRRLFEQKSRGTVSYCMPLPFQAIPREVGSRRRPSKFIHYSRILKLEPSYENYCRTRLAPHQGGRRSSSHKEEIACQAICETADAGNPLLVFEHSLTESEFKRRVRLMPTRWAQREDVKACLSRAMHNGLPSTVKGPITEFLVDGGCFDWLKDNWLTQNHALLCKQAGGVFGIGIAAAIGESRELRPILREELRAILQEKQASGIPQLLPLEGSDEARYEDLGTERLRVLLRKAEASEVAS